MSLRIFVIDREECVRESLRLYLEDSGHEVQVASEPDACHVYRGHDCTRDHPCGHALFIGYHLPRMNGLDFIELMEERGCKGMARHKVLMSGNTSAIDREKATRLGCRVLQKPVTLQTVAAIVNKVETSVPDDEVLMAI